MRDVFRSGRARALGSLIALVAPMCLAAAALPVQQGQPVIQGAPEPEPIPTRWELMVTPGPLRVASVDVPGVGPQWFFFFTYKVVNHTGNEVLFAPSFELSTDDGDLITAGRGVPYEVTEELLRRLDNTFLQSQTSIIGPLLQGEENAKEGLVVWPVPAINIDRVTIYAKGFSGEFKTIEFPVGDGEPVRITFNKQLMIRYTTPGELRADSGRPLPVSERRWVMR